MNTENNKLIAEFLNLLTKEDNVKIWNNAPKYVNELTRIEDAKFHSDWNWLMQVVEKIESLNHLVVIENTLCNIATSKGFENVIIKNENSKIESVYNACIKFIKWYNNQN